MPNLPCVSVAEAEVLDLAAIRAGVPARCLMEIAGAGACTVLVEQLRIARDGRPVAVVAGRGRNAGDAFVVARHLAAGGRPVRVFSLDNPETWPEGEARANAQVLGAYGVVLSAVTPEQLRSGLADAGVIVDGLLGTGARGELREPIRSFVDVINASALPVLALDLPSGLCGDLGVPLGIAVAARWTVTFGAIKAGLLKGEGPRLAGELTLVPLPFPPQAVASILGSRSPSP